MKTIIEIIIGIFAGYCCCYFIADKLADGMTPGEVIEEYFKILGKRLRMLEEKTRR